VNCGASEAVAAFTALGVLSVDAEDRRSGERGGAQEAPQSIAWDGSRAVEKEGTAGPNSFASMFAWEPVGGQGEGAARLRQ
jgi:hypothetical protein